MTDSVPQPEAAPERVAADPLFGTQQVVTDVSRRAASGSVLMVGAQFARLALTMATTAVLARLLTPGEFGLVAMVTTLAALLQVTADLGLSQAMVQRREITRAQVSGLFWLNAAFAVVLTALCFGLAWPLSWFYDQPDLVRIAQVYSLDFLILGLTAQYQAILARQLRFRVTAVMQIVATVFSSVVAVLIALAGGGVWALVALQLSFDGAVLVYSVAVCRWWPDRPRWTEGLGDMLRFGRDVALNNFLVYIVPNADRILIGVAFGNVVLGLYDRSANMIRLPMRAIVVPLHRVIVPSLARLQDDPEAYRSVYRHALGKTAMVTLPLSLAIAALAPETVRILLGGQWLDAIPMLALLAVSACAQPLNRALGWLWVSQGRTGEMLRWSLFSVPVVVAGYAIALSFGPLAVAGSAIITQLGLVPIAFALAGRRGPVRFGDVARALLPAVLGGAAMSVAIHLAREGIALPPNPLLAALVLSAIGGLTLLAVYLIVPSARRALLDVLAMAGRRKTVSGTAAGKA